jgi:hypothetical protein
MHKDYQNKENNESLNKTFAIIHGQCNRAMKAKIEDDQLGNHRQELRPNRTPKDHQRIAHNNESQKPNSVPYLAEQRLMNMTQADGQSNDSYRLKFENQTSSRTWDNNFIGLDTQHCLQAER